MIKFRRAFLSCALIFCLTGVSFAAGVEAGMGSLTGSVVWSDSKEPLSDATVYVGDRATGEVLTSTRTTDEGSFDVSGLPASSYRLAVETGGGLYPISTAVQISPGQSRRLHVAVLRNQDLPNAQPSGNEPGGAGFTIWNNPLTASFVVIGSAVVVGLLVDELTDDEDSVSGSASLP
ncbi:MAG: carboxypeptidase regulatory-like domain-containing protein [bacterium]|nr:carboxypeptidase regulatory-like domain-containing protein [bacterium]